MWFQGREAYSYRQYLTFPGPRTYRLVVSNCTSRLALKYADIFQRPRNQREEERETRRSWKLDTVCTQEIVQVVRPTRIYSRAFFSQTQLTDTLTYYTYCTTSCVLVLSFKALHLPPTGRPNIDYFCAAAFRSGWPVGVKESGLGSSEQLWYVIDCSHLPLLLSHRGTTIKEKTLLCVQDNKQRRDKCRLQSPSQFVVRRVSRPLRKQTCHGRFWGNEGLPLPQHTIVRVPTGSTSYLLFDDMQLTTLTTTNTSISSMRLPL